MTGSSITEMGLNDVDATQALAGLNVTYQRCCATCNESSSKSPPTLEPYEIRAPDAGRLPLYYDHPTCDDEAVKFKIPSVLVINGTLGEADIVNVIEPASVSLVDGTSAAIPCT
jgi:hypothetical protein